LQNTRSQKTDELLKIAIEIVVGVILTLIISTIIDLSISSFLPEYAKYELYIQEGAQAAIILIIGLLITKSIMEYVENKFSTTRKELYGLSLIIRIVMYIIIFALVLSVFRVSLTGLLAGSAIGGIVLGLAVQTVASNLLSGIFVTSTKTLKYGDMVNVNSWIWSLNTIGKITEVKTLFFKILTKDNNIVSIPNSALLGSGVVVEYKQKDSKYSYPTSITTMADVPADKIIEYIKNYDKNIDIYLSEKSGMTNVFLVPLKFDDVLEINEKTSEINRIVDKAYWDIKSEMLLMGTNTYEYNRTGNVYPLTVNLNSDVPADKIIKNVHEKDKKITVYLLSKAGANNIFSANFKYKTRDEIMENINRINLLFESAYEELKTADTKKANKPASPKK